MLLLLTVSILLIFITLNLGILARELLGRLFRTTLQTDLLELFLLGLMLSSFYFNMLSFWLPVNYWSLLVPGLLAIGVTIFHKDQTRAVRQSIRANLQLFFSSGRWPATVLIGIVLLVYWILPCGTVDSLVYHFQSIAWYEKYKVIPGIANLNGRLAFNPASFLIQSAYSFSGPVGQPLYPLNGVAALFLFSWLLLRVFRAGRSLTSLLYTALIVLVYRHTLIDVTSPSSDGLSVVCMLYVLIRLAEYRLSNKNDLGRVVVPTLVILYAITIKPATFALLLALPLLFFTLPREQRKTTLMWRTAIIGLLLFLPWIGRNYILSGFLVFPFSFTGWLHPDWQTPLSVVQREINYIKVMPKTDDNWSPAAVASARTLFGWFPSWIRVSLRIRTIDILCLFLALLSPLYWLIGHGSRKAPPADPQRRRLFPLWLITYIAVLAWLQASPVFRFGAIYVYAAFLLPAFDFASIRQNRTAMKTAGARPALILIALISAGFYYVYTGFQHPTTYKFSLADCWLKPLKPIWADSSQKKDFPYRTLRNGTKLYVADSAHDCINTCLPCMEFNYGEVEMRGPRIEDGFRNTRDEVKLHYPATVQ